MTLINFLLLPAENWSDPFTRGSFADFLEESGDERSAIIREIEFEKYKLFHGDTFELWYLRFPENCLYSLHSTLGDKQSGIKEIHLFLMFLFTNKCGCANNLSPGNIWIYNSGGGGYWTECTLCNGRKWVIKTNDNNSKGEPE